MMNNAKPERDDKSEVLTESRNSVIVCIDVPGDTTTRPRRPEIPRSWLTPPPAPEGPPPRGDA
jgi:hypothetical protein